MKIAHVCPYSPTQCYCGVGQAAFEICKRQVAMGHQVNIITSDWDKTKRIKIKEEIVERVHIYYCHHYFRISSFSSAWPSVYKKLLKLKPDLIHLHIINHLHSYLSLKAAKKLGVPIIANSHCPWESKRSLAGRVFNYISMNFFPVLKHVDAIISITPWEHKFLKAEGVDENKIYTLPNGMDKMFFEKIEPNTFKEKHSIPKDHKIVLFFGRLSYTKNPQMFVKIAKAILHKRSDTTFCLIGPDEGELNSVKKMIDNLHPKIKKNFRLIPPIRDRKEVVEMYQSSDIYVLPSRREGAPLTQQEAYASGLPIVASNVNGVSDSLENNVNGFLLPHSDTKRFIKKINILLNNEELRNKMSNNNIIKSKGFDWDLIAKKTMNIYKKLI